MISVAPRAKMKYHERQWHVALVPRGAPLQQSPAGADSVPWAWSLCPCQLSSRCPCPVHPASPDPAHPPLRPPCLSAHLSRQGWVIPGMLFGKPLPPAHFLETNKKKKIPEMLRHTYSFCFWAPPRCDFSALCGSSGMHRSSRLPRDRANTAMPSSRRATSFPTLCAFTSLRTCLLNNILYMI